VGGQRDQRRKWIQCFNEVTAVMFVVDISSFNMTLREDSRVNRLTESLQSFRQIWINRYLVNTSIILFLNKYDLFVRKILDERCRLEDYFPEFTRFEQPAQIEKHLVMAGEHPQVTRAKMFILEEFIKITNERLKDAQFKVSQYEAMNAAHESAAAHGATTQTTQRDRTGDRSSYASKLERQLKQTYHEAKEESVSGKFCICYFTCAVDTENIKRVFKACSSILKKEHLEKSGLL
jgi:GTPase SAR1 family protein